MYLFARALPRVEFEEETAKKNLIERWVTSEFPEKFDAWLDGFLLKFLRKLKVLILRFDNFVGNCLKRFKAENQNGNHKTDFKEITGEVVTKNEKEQN